MNPKTTMIVGSLLAGAWFAHALPAQSQEALIEMRDQKLASGWLQDAGWITDYDEARANAKATGKPIFAYFTRSFAP